MRKAQMFIVTTIFLVALVFAVQQMLIQGLSIDVTSSLEADDFYMIRSVENVFNKGIDSGMTCEELLALADFIKDKSVKEGFSIQIEKITFGSNDCKNFPKTTPNAINIAFYLNGKGIERHVESHITGYI